MIISIYFSLIYSNFQWFSRSGSITILLGAILSVRRLLILGPYEFYQSSKIIDCGNFEPTPQEIKESREAQLDTSALHYGSFLVIVGTLISGYGDWIMESIKDYN
jgi:hypothetical protein